MATKLCTCCKRPLPITDAGNVRPMIYDFMYALIGECPACFSTVAWVVWELPDELLLVDGDLGPLSHDRDSREEAA